MGLGIGDFLGACVDAVFCGACGLGRAAGTRRPYFDPSLPNDSDVYDKLYHQGQSHLGNLMTVSTLLLGFTVSGTFLAVVLTGNENYDAEQLFDFVEAAGKAAIAAAGTLVLALAVSVRSSSGYTHVSAQRGHYNMQRGSCYTAIAEFLVYVSFYFFADTLGQFVTMQFAGPDICPLSGSSLVKEVAFCARLGQDFYAEAETVCAHKNTTTALMPRLDSQGGAASATAAAHTGGTQVIGTYTGQDYMTQNGLMNMDGTLAYGGPPLGDFGDYGVETPADAKKEADGAMCTAYRYLFQNNWSSYQYWFGYSIGYFPETLLNTTDIIDESRLQIAVSAAGYVCALDKMADNRKHACDYELADPSLDQSRRTECSQAIVSYTKAEDCRENMVSDAEKCYKVCSKRKKDGQTPSERLALLVSVGTNPMKVVFFFFGCFRLLSHMVEGAVNHYRMMKDESEHDESGCYDKTLLEEEG